jgi:hypothetical protein
MEKMDGIEIEYLVVVKEILNPISGGHYIESEWYNQNDVYANKEEFISKLI